MIAKNICHAAMAAGYSVLFRSAPALLDDLNRQIPEGRRRKLRAYANTGLLCIDEMGYMSSAVKDVEGLFEIINCRYERKATLVIANRPTEAWYDVFPDATCVATLLDRLLHHADLTVIEGLSYRLRESEQEAAARRNKP
jgi:DNA replication protein DnaC